MKYFFSLIFILSFQTAVSQSDTLHSTLKFTTKEKSRVAMNENYFYQFSADSAGSSIVYSVEALPPFLQYDSADHSLSGKAAKAGQYPVQIIASGGKNTVHQNFMLTVYDKNTTNILCLGNSITNGVDTFNSYRRYLWQMLHEGNYNFDFIGSWSKHHMGGEVPIADFDMEHEGHSGWTFENILKPPEWDSTRGNLHQWINEYKPDIVLIELGTNDVFQCRTPQQMFGNLNVILFTLREKNKNVKIFIAQIPPLGAQWSEKKLCNNDTSYSQAIINLNENIKAYAGEHSTNRSAVTVVDQYTGINPATDMFDDIHPNTKGEK